MLYFREFAIQVSSEYKNSLKRCAKVKKYRTVLNQAYFGLFPILNQFFVCFLMVGTCVLLLLELFTSNALLCATFLSLVRTAQRIHFQGKQSKTKKKFTSIEILWLQRLRQLFFQQMVTSFVGLISRKFKFESKCTYNSGMSS